MSKLTIAATQGEIERVRELLKTGETGKNPEKTLAKALILAALHGQLEIVEVLVKAGANLNYISDCGTALHYAMTISPSEVPTDRQMAIAQFLIEAGTDLSLTDDPQNVSSRGWTPLMVAVNSSMMPIVRQLIKAGSDVHHRDKKGCTPLIIAAKCGNYGAINLLIEAGAEIEAQDDYGHTALAHALRDWETEALDPTEAEMKFVEMQEALRSVFGAENARRLDRLFEMIDQKERWGRSLCGKLLREAGASTECLKGLHLVQAAQKGDLDQVRSLLEAGVNINSRDTNGVTVLMAATTANKASMVEFLIKQGADVNLNNEGVTALMKASMEGHDGIVKLLIEGGADLNVPVDQETGYTALTQAQIKGHQDVVEVLKQAGAKHYRKIPLAEVRGVESLDVSSSLLFVFGSVPKVARSFSDLQKANIWRKDIFDRVVELTEKCFTVSRFTGHPWTIIKEQHLFKDSSQINPAQAQHLSQELKTQAIYYNCDDFDSSVSYQMFDRGKLVESFAYTYDSEIGEVAPTQAGECVLVGKDYYWRSFVRQLTIDDLPQLEIDDDIDADDELATIPQLDVFKFVDNFARDRNLYIPAWIHRVVINLQTIQIRLNVPGIELKDVERMDFIALKMGN